MKRAILHGGDNDSTGTIAAAWFGALYGLENVPKSNWINVEDRIKLENYGTTIAEQFSK